MLDQIVGNITGLRGVLHACLYKDGQQLASTFPVEQATSMIQTAEIIEQAFSALQSIQKSHNEIYFSVDNKYLAAFLLHESYIAILLTEKKINHPLIHMGIKSASEKIRHTFDEQQKQQVQAKTQPATVEALEPAIEPQAAIITPTDESLAPVFAQYANILTSFLGPAAKFVVDDCVDLWKKKYIQNRENLPHLVEYIQQELDSNEEQNDFAQRAKQITE